MLSLNACGADILLLFYSDFAIVIAGSLFVIMAII
jgi:hypothetical protein